MAVSTRSSSGNLEPRPLFFRGPAGRNDMHLVPETSKPISTERQKLLVGHWAAWLREDYPRWLNSRTSTATSQPQASGHSILFPVTRCTDYCDLSCSRQVLALTAAESASGQHGNVSCLVPSVSRLQNLGRSQNL